MGEIRYAPICNPALRRNVVMTTHPASHFPRATSLVMALIRQEIAALSETGVWEAKLLFEAE
jgi:hypothetical protein